MKGKIEKRFEILEYTISISTNIFENLGKFLGINKLTKFDNLNG